MKNNNLMFRFMALEFKVRDYFNSPEDILRVAGIQPGFHVLDFGCGPGSFSLAAARLVGDTGKVYALDIHPLAIKMVEEKARANHLSNIETIASQGEIPLADASIDMALVYDVYHDLETPESLLKILHRILKPGGILSFSDHHLKVEQVMPDFTRNGWYKLQQQEKKTYRFVKVS
ncbi:methyltransferase domain-containing protein [candidate division KSB1 bacterium]|nr:methyltransferase domain-containing protein [candidate division KSB1 bacterium]